MIKIKPVSFIAILHSPHPKKYRRMTQFNLDHWLVVDLQWNTE